MKQLGQGGLLWTSLGELIDQLGPFDSCWTSWFIGMPAGNQLDEAHE